MKPAIRNGLTALIVLLVAANVAVLVVRHGRDDKTRVSVAPAPSSTPPSTAEPLTPASPTTETTVGPTTTLLPTTTVVPTPAVAPTTTVAPTTGAGTPVVPGLTDASVTTTTLAPSATTVPGAISVPAADPGVVQASPPAAEHPQTGGHALSLLAILLLGVGLVGLRFSRRTRSNPNP